MANSSGPVATEQRVSWPDRAAYLAVLSDLKRAVERESDAAQVGAPVTVRFGQLLTEAASARKVYACRVETAKMLSETLKVKPPNPRPRKRRSPTPKPS